MKNALENLIISMCFDVDVSIITLLLAKLHIPSSSLLSIPQEAMSQFFMIILFHALSLLLHSVTDIKHITQEIMEWGARLLHSSAVMGYLNCAANGRISGECSSCDDDDKEVLQARHRLGSI